PLGAISYGYSPAAKKPQETESHLFAYRITQASPEKPTHPLCIPTTNF
ncbi:hypothetical protein PGQ11_005931, partial [Apiospora arundinis]